MSIFLLIVGVIAVASIVYVAGFLLKSGPPDHERTIVTEGQSTVELSGEVLMMHHDGVHHPVAAQIMVTTAGKRFLGSTSVREDNTFSLKIPADVRGEVEVGLALHGASQALVTAEGDDLHVVVMYNPVNNFFA